MVHENGRGRIPGDSQNRGQIENGARSENPPSDGNVQKRKAVKEERKTKKGTSCRWPSMKGHIGVSQKRAVLANNNSKRKRVDIEKKSLKERP